MDYKQDFMVSKCLVTICSNYSNAYIKEFENEVTDIYYKNPK